ncbi:RNA-directed DNA polymerase, eukaryota, reverse transcriptase zinc-binding domain protein [Tanacetum coccineum]|uniref:RNA-directed DNA polymerase, eukaryota, reverse transcriptase zinc-binding domain protein n=1 Tax=Tanacetum coccineum TaxID=301880 RepID=A0ABQ5J368_9ASTR
MKTRGFWDAVITYFKKETGSTRGYDSIVSKWKNRVRPRIDAFCTIIHNVEANHESGTNDLDGRKKSKTSKTTSGSSGGINLNDEADEAVEETQEVRPMGRDQSKAKKKSVGSSRGGSSSFVDLGSDGYSFAFVKKYWGTIQKDLYDFVNLFFATCVMPNGANSSFFTLIPKVNNPTLITDFRPISLIGIHYKIIAKILANRLSKVIDKIVSKEQSAFIAGRQILDGPVILSEIIEWYKKRKKKLLIFKVDFEKAFDSISWNYLIHILDSFGFGNKWCSWIKACLNSSRASILINGSPTSEFSIKRGLRQGDPLSPFLFILVMEGLHNAFEEAVGNGLITGVNIKNSTINVSHLFYADDVIITTDWNAKDMDNIIRVLHVFYLASGLKINIHKSNIYGIGVNKDEVLSMASNAGCMAGDVPFNYLGLPIGSNMKSIASWKTLVDRFHMRLSSWKANLLSIGGRLTLIKSVLGSLGIYYLSIFRAPESVLQDLERIRANFFWGGNKDKNKMAWVKWPIILNSFDKGGLNIGSLKAFNLALLQKWRWRLLSSPNALWVQVIKAYHGQEGGFDTNGCSFKGIWANIVGTSNFLHSKGIILSNTFRFKAGCGTRIRFWKDIWVGETPLFTRYNRLYHLDQDKDCLIIDRINNGQWSWNWSRTNLGVRNLAYLCDMLNEIGQLNIDVNEDTCTWSLGRNGTFTVKDARYRIDQNILPTLAHTTTWDKSIPRKVNVFMWRLSLDRLPHRLNLSSRGMDIPAISCPSCNANVESANHVFFECDIATDMWKLVFRWCDIPLFQASSWDSFNDWIISWHASKEKKHRFYVITTSVLWWLWRYRNSVTFSSQPLRKSDLFDNVRFSSFSWLHNRDHMKLSWNDWLMMSTLVFVDSESSTQADGAQSSRVPVPLPEDPYEAIRQAYLDGTDTESEPFKDPVKTDTTASMVVRVPPAKSSGLSASMTEVAAMSESAFRKRFKSSYESSPSLSPPDLPSRKRYRGTSELVEDSDEDDDDEDEEIEDSIDSDSVSEGAEEEGPTAEDEDLAARDEGFTAGVEGPGMDDESYGLDGESHGMDDESRGLDDEGHGVESDGLGLKEEEEAVPGGQQQAAPVGSGSAPESETPERVSASKQPTLTTWTDPEDGMVYIDVPAYPPSAPPVQHPPSPEWTSGSLPISPSPSVIPSPISSPMIPLTGGLIRDHAVRLEELLPALFKRHDRDIGELFTRSGRLGMRFSPRGQTGAQRATLWHAISDVQGENRDLRLQLAEERCARLELAEIVDAMRRWQEPKGGA